MQFLKFLSIMAIAWLVNACASQQSLTGGPKDEVPPKLLRVLPKDQSVNYRGTLIRLEFDEYIEANDLKKELLIAPLTQVRFNQTIKKNILEIRFDSALEANTTYSLNFRAGVGDFSEKNKVPDLKLAFSTGDNLDSLWVGGTVLNPLTGKPAENTSVLLFSQTDTLRLEKGKPIYLANSDKDGNFRINNVRPGRYWLEGIQEKDSDMRYTKREERIAAHPQELVVADSNLSGFTLQLMDYDYQPFKLIRSRKNKQYFDFIFSKPFQTFSLILPDSLKGRVLAGMQKETLRLYGPAQLDSFQVQLKAIDSAGIVIDTVSWASFEVPKKASNEPFAIEKKDIPEGVASKDTLRFTLSFSKPVATFVPDSARIYANKDTLAWGVEPQWDVFRTAATFIFPPQVLPATFTFKKGAFISIEKDSLVPFNAEIKLLDEESYGIVVGKIETWSESFLLQLLDDKGTVEQELKNSRNFRFARVKPGNKQLRVLFDENKNGKWDKGDYRLRQLPERVLFYKGELNVKSNWEIELKTWQF